MLEHQSAFHLDALSRQCQFTTASSVCVARAWACGSRGDVGCYCLLVELSLTTLSSIGLFAVDTWASERMLL